MGPRPRPIATPARAQDRRRRRPDRRPRAAEDPGLLPDLPRRGARSRRSRGRTPSTAPTYLPRKFKIGITHEADNHHRRAHQRPRHCRPCSKAKRFSATNIAVGGGLGMTHNNARTYPRLATPVAFVGPGDLLRIIDAVVHLQRDHGDRTDRRRARLKYVVDDRGLPLDTRNPGRLFWRAALRPQADEAHRAGHPRLARTRRRPAMARHPGRCGPHLRRCKLYPAHGAARNRPDPQARLHLHGTAAGPAADRHRARRPRRDRGKAARASRGACGRPVADGRNTPSPALPCPPAAWQLTEAERNAPPKSSVVSNALLAKHGLADRRLSIRITGCPNGCARTYAGDIGIVGRMPGFYALYTGGDFEGNAPELQAARKSPARRGDQHLRSALRILGGGRPTG